MAMQLVQSQQGSVAGPTQNAGLAGSTMQGSVNGL